MLPKRTPRLWKTRYPGDEADCVIVGSRGLMKSCATATRPVPRNPPRLPPGLLWHHREGQPIYVHTQLLQRFRDRFLDRLRKPFVLVSGDSDRNLGGPQVPADVIEDLAGHPHLIAWFAQNAVVEHPRIHRMPLGLDYHTLSIGMLRAWGPKMTPVEQEAVLEQVRREAPPLPQRETQAFCNAHLTLSHPVRRTLVQDAQHGVLHVQKTKMSRIETWRLNTRFAATASPRGHGMDCHRTWEALLLGALPIVDDLPTNSLLAGLPHLVVTSWSDLTTEAIAEARRAACRETFDFAPVLLAYWQDRFAGRPGGTLRMTYQDFMDTPIPALLSLYSRS